MWFERLQKLKLIKTVFHFPCTYLGGARQVGKTALLRQTFPDYEYISLDSPLVTEMVLNHPETFFKQHPRTLIIDEIQYAPELFRYLKQAIDEDRTQAHYIVSGSQHFSLMQNLTESLAGRCAILSLSPLTYPELAITRSLSTLSFLDLILKGGYPELWKSDIDANLWFQSYITTYLERDVRQLLNVGSSRDFGRFLRAVALRSGQLLSYTDLAKDVGIAVSTARQWVSVLQASHLIILLEPYFKNIGKRLIKTPKLYFVDSGLACRLNGITTPSHLQNSPLLGHLWETYVLSQLMTLAAYADQTNLWFWRTSDGHEIDLVLEMGGRYRLIEIKLKEHITNAHLKQIQLFEKLVSTAAIDRSFVISTTPYPYRVGNTTVLPLQDLQKVFEA